MWQVKGVKMYWNSPPLKTPSLESKVIQQVLSVSVKPSFKGQKGEVSTGAVKVKCSMAGEMRDDSHLPSWRPLLKLICAHLKLGERNGLRMCFLCCFSGTPVFFACCYPFPPAAVSGIYKPQQTFNTDGEANLHLKTLLSFHPGKWIEST